MRNTHAFETRCPRFSDVLSEKHPRYSDTVSSISDVLGEKHPRFSDTVSSISDSASSSDRPHHPSRHRFCPRCKPRQTMSIDFTLSHCLDSVFNLFLCLLFNDESRWTNSPVKASLKFTTPPCWMDAGITAARSRYRWSARQTR